MKKVCQVAWFGRYLCVQYIVVKILFFMRLISLETMRMSLRKYGAFPVLLEHLRGAGDSEKARTIVACLGTLAQERIIYFMKRFST
jgi:hypothetical protein